jgi:hypothetical protein
MPAFYKAEGWRRDTNFYAYNLSLKPGHY